LGSGTWSSGSPDGTVRGFHSGSIIVLETTYFGTLLRYSLTPVSSSV